jgi:hypothetical protein
MKSLKMIEREEENRILGNWRYPIANKKFALINVGLYVRQAAVALWYNNQLTILSSRVRI